MKKSILPIVLIIILGIAAFAVATFLTSQQSQNPGDTRSQQQSASDKSEKPEPGMVEEETDAKSSLPDKAGNIDESNLSPEQQQRRDTKQNQ